MTAMLIDKYYDTYRSPTIRTGAAQDLINHIATEHSVFKMYINGLAEPLANDILTQTIKKHQTVKMFNNEEQVFSNLQLNFYRFNSKVIPKDKVNIN